MTAPIKIIDGLYQFTRFQVNIFILEHEDELTIIDAGFPGSTQSLMEAIKTLGYAPSAVKHILITHADLDHVGSLAGIAAATGAEVHASATTRTHISNVTSPEHVPIAFLLSPVQKLMQKPAVVDHVFADDDVLDIAGGIRVVYCPGHTDENYCFYWEGWGVLFAPDLLHRIPGRLTLTQPAISWDTAAAKRSAIRTLELEPQIICVGHGDALMGDALKREVEALRTAMR